MWSLLEVGLVLQTGDDVVECGPVFGDGVPAGLGQGGEVGWPPATDRRTLPIDYGHGRQDVAGGIMIRYLVLHQLPGDDGIGKDVAMHVDGVIPGHLRSHPAWCACSAGCGSCSREKFRCSKVADLGHHVIGKENIAGLEITVDVVELVHICHSVGNLLGPGQTLLLRWFLFSLVEEVVQRSFLRQSCDDGGLWVIVCKPIKGNDVGVPAQFHHDLSIGSIGCAVDLLQGYIKPSGLPPPTKHSPKPTLSQEVPELEVCHVDLIAGGLLGWSLSLCE